MLNTMSPQRCALQSGSPWLAEETEVLSLALRIAPRAKWSSLAPLLLGPEQDLVL